MDHVGQQEKVKWYYGIVPIAFALILFFPLGLILLWKSPSPTKTAKVVISSVFGLIVLISMINNNASHRTEVTQNVTPSDVASRAAPTVSPVSESCLALSKKFGTGSKLSDLQKENEWPTYKGHSFEWDLEIVEVSSGMFSGFTVQAKCAPTSPSLVQDIQISYGNGAKSFVSQLQKGSIYKMRGVLTNTSTFFGLGADGSEP